MDIRDEINQLKKEKDAVILAHYYVRPEVQEIADYTGDSFYLSRTAEKLTSKVLVFAGVSFMGESAKLLNPERWCSCRICQRTAPWPIWQMRGLSAKCGIHTKTWRWCATSTPRLS